MRITISDAFGQSWPIDCHEWTLVSTVKQQLISKQQKFFSLNQQRLFFAGRELKNRHTLHDYGVVDHSELFTITASSENSRVDFIDVYANVSCPEDLRNLIQQARQGLSMGLAPRLSMEGTGGTYMLRGKFRRNVAVFKAEDEEAFCPNNPRGYIGLMGQEGFRRGVRSGEGALREVAAYLLDHGGFASVPPTTRVEISASALSSATNRNEFRIASGIPLSSEPSFASAPPVRRSASSDFLTLRDFAANLQWPSSFKSREKTKVGSLQEFVHFDEMAGDVGSQYFPVREVHKIAILDIRILNIDRNDANILVVRNQSDNPSDMSTGILSSSPSLSSSVPEICSPELGFEIAPMSPPYLGSSISADSSAITRLQARLNAVKGQADVQFSSSSRDRKRVETIKLIPIDHSYSLPDTLEIGWTEWVWLDWPQIRKPLDEECKKYVLSLDIEADIELLRKKLAIREPCLRVMRIMGIVLQKGVAADLTLYEIASFICREQLEEPSQLEILCAQATTLAQARAARVRPTGSRSINQMLKLPLSRTIVTTTVNPRRLSAETMPNIFKLDEDQEERKQQEVDFVETSEGSAVQSLSKRASRSLRSTSFRQSKMRVSTIAPKSTLQNVKHSYSEKDSTVPELRRSISYDDIRKVCVPRDGFGSTADVPLSPQASMLFWESLNDLLDAKFSKHL